MNIITFAQLLPQLILPPHIANLPVGDLRLDTRLLNPGDVFICIGGEAFISDAVNGEAIAILREGNEDVSEGSHSDPVIITVPNLSAILPELASRKYSLSSANPLALIGVTGTNGKSTLVSLIAQLLQKACFVDENRGFMKTATMGTLGVGVLGEPLAETGMTTPDVFSNYKTLAEFSSRDVGCVAMEVSSHGLSQGRVAGLPISTAVFTNLTQDHLDYHGDLTSYAEAKQKLFSMPSVQQIIVNADDDHAELMASSKSSILTIRYGIHSGEVRAENIYTRQAGTAFTLYSPWGNTDVISPFYGVFNVYNLLGAIATAMVQGADFNRVIESIPSLLPITGRMQQLTPVGGVQVVVDFAHTPDGLEQALIALKAHTVGRIWVVFGCGGNRDKQKRALMGAIAEDIADELVLTSDNPRNENPDSILSDIASGCKKAARIITDRKEAIEYSIAHATAGDCILIAGKGHETYQIIKEQKIPFSDITIAEQALAQKHVIDFTYEPTMESGAGQ